jgi:hypothetical protein
MTSEFEMAFRLALQERFNDIKAVGFPSSTKMTIFKSVRPDQPGQWKITTRERNYTICFISIQNDVVSLTFSKGMTEDFSLCEPGSIDKIMDKIAQWDNDIMVASDFGFQD